MKMQIQPKTVRWQCVGVLILDGDMGTTLITCHHGVEWRKVDQAALNRAVDQKHRRDLKARYDAGMKTVTDDIKKIIKTVGFGRRLPAIYKYLGMDEKKL